MSKAKNDGSPRSINIVIKAFEAKTIEKLPDEMACLIGHIAQKYAELEYLLHITIREVAEVNEIVGRIIIGNARVEDQVTKIEDLLTARGFLKTNPPLADIKMLVKKAQIERDAIVHGVWISDEATGDLKLYDTKGNWNLQSADVRATKRMYPTFRQITKDQLAHTLKHIEDTDRWVHGLYHAAHSLRGKSPAQVPQDPQADDQTRNKP